MSPMPRRITRGALIAVLAIIGPLLSSAHAAPVTSVAGVSATQMAPAAPATPAAQVAAAARIANGKYAGTTLEDGKRVKKEWVRFKVRRHNAVVRFRSRVWLHCYVYPNQYYSLPVVFTMRKARIRDRRIDRSWTKSIVLEDSTETLKGRVKLRFRAGGKVTGKLSIDVANCASRLGDPPYWVSLRARHL